MVNFGPLTAEIIAGVHGTPSKFQQVSHLGFVTSATSLLHDVWLSPGLVHYIYIFGGCCPLTEFCHMQNSPSV